MLLSPVRASEIHFIKGYDNFDLASIRRRLVVQFIDTSRQSRLQKAIKTMIVIFLPGGVLMMEPSSRQTMEVGVPP
jgi:hypothetical protein